MIIHVCGGATYHDADPDCMINDAKNMTLGDVAWPTVVSAGLDPVKTLAKACAEMERVLDEMNEDNGAERTGAIWEANDPETSPAGETTRHYFLRVRDHGREGKALACIVHREMIAVDTRLDPNTH